MSKAVRVKPSLLARLVQRISNTDRSGLRGYFAATDINYANDMLADETVSAPMDISLPSIPDICVLPALDLPLIEPLAINTDGPVMADKNYIQNLNVNTDAPIHLPAPLDAKSLPCESVDIEALVDTLEFSGAKVKEVKALPSGGNCIKVEDFFEDYQEREYEYVKVRG